MAKLNGFITRRVQYVKQTANQTALRQQFDKMQLYIIRNEVFHMYDSMKNKNLFNMEETIAKDIFEDCDYRGKVASKDRSFYFGTG